MTLVPAMAKHLQLIETKPGTCQHPVGLLKFRDLLGIAHTASGSWIEKLPFAPADTTAGTETELQTVVIGPRHAVDLPRSIENSKFFRNITKRAATGDTPQKIVAALEAYLGSPEETWENSWVRFPRRVLNVYAESVFQGDMRADKRMAVSPPRCDAGRFTCRENGEEMLRIPVSYLLKLALAHVIGQHGVPAIVRSTGEEMMAHFLNDNTSPETHSFHPLSQADGERVGAAVAVETPLVFKALTSARATRWLSLLNYDLPLYRRPARLRKLIHELNIDLHECLDEPGKLDSARKLFERRIKYWRFRSMPEEPGTVVAPADAKALVGSWKQIRQLFLKEKFFSFKELLGRRQKHWQQAFQDGDFAVFRLTLDKYHHNHLPVAGRVVDFYAIDGDYHSCNPSAVVAEATPFSKNKRVVTVIDTDLPGGTRVGLVAMVEVVALMICSRHVRPAILTESNSPHPISLAAFAGKKFREWVRQPGLVRAGGRRHVSNSVLVPVGCSVGKAARTV